MKPMISVFTIAILLLSNSAHAIMNTVCTAEGADLRVRVFHYGPNLKSVVMAQILFAAEELSEGSAKVETVNKLTIVSFKSGKSLIVPMDLQSALLLNENGRLISSLHCGSNR